MEILPGGGKIQTKSRDATKASAVPSPVQPKKPRTSRGNAAAAPGLATARETRIVADIDVGFGNLVYIRGDGGGLSWDKGQPLTCSDHRTWVWSTSSAKDHFFFKLLLNDTLWAAGENIIASPGDTVTVVPLFG